jgi:N-methylhydantoinase A
MAAEGAAPGDLRLDRALDLRYAGQSYELTVSATKDFAGRFRRLHEKTYGHAYPGRAVDLVTVRLRAVARAPHRRLQARGKTRRAEAGDAILGHQRMLFGGKWGRGPVLDRERLAAGARMNGPAIIVEPSATTILPPDFRLRVDAEGNLLLSSAASPRRSRRPARPKAEP